MVSRSTASVMRCQDFNRSARANIAQLPNSCFTLSAAPFLRFRLVENFNARPVPLESTLLVHGILRGPLTAFAEKRYPKPSNNLSPERIGAIPRIGLWCELAHLEETELCSVKIRLWISLAAFLLSFPEELSREAAAAVRAYVIFRANQSLAESPARPN
jgi:hypothetical protein